MVAEPWDIGPGGYKVGGFPPGWAEWNGAFRDTVRRFWKGDGGLIGEFAQRLTGSSDLYERSGRLMVGMRFSKLSVEAQASRFDVVFDNTTYTVSDLERQARPALDRAVERAVADLNTRKPSAAITAMVPVPQRKPSGNWRAVGFGRGEVIP